MLTARTLDTPLDAPLAAPSLASRLREETREAHRAAERGHLVGRLLRGRVSRSTYVAYIAAMYRVYTALEAGLERHRPLAALAPLHWPALWRGDALARDLAALAGPGWMGHVARDIAAEPYVDRLRGLDRSAPALLVAHVYTRYLGDLSGGQFLRAGAARVAPEALDFYDFSAVGDLDQARKSLRARLDAVPTELGDAIVFEARRAFALSGAVLDAVSAADEDDAPEQLSTIAAP